MGGDYGGVPFCRPKGNRKRLRCLCLLGCTQFMCVRVHGSCRVRAPGPIGLCLLTQTRTAVRRERVRHFSLALTLAPGLGMQQR